MVGQRIDRRERLVASGAGPVLGQLFAVEPRPFLDKALGAGRKLATDDLERVDRDQGLVLTVAGMEVRRRVIRQYILMTMP